MTNAPAAVASETQSSSTVPVLGEGFHDNSQTSPTLTSGSDESGMQGRETDGKKRHFWQLGKKKEDKKKANAAAIAATSAAATSNPSSALPPGSTMARSPSPSSPNILPSSPGRVHSSPRVASPASSQIFERNVQEDVAATTTSPAIPSHITTENHIPPVLDASSMAITDDHLNPDTVEIVTHAAHQPAALPIASSSDPSAPSPLYEEAPLTQSQSQLGTSPPVPLPVPLQHTVLGSDAGLSDDSASNYGNLDSADVRRLSFISFADVVHAEQAASSGDHTSMRDSLLVSPAPTSTIVSPVAAAARSPSPIRSPISPTLSAGSGSTSPRSGIAEGSPPPLQRSAGSPRPGNKGLGLAVGQPAGAELTVETMAQALRKTGSGDLSGFRTGEEGEMDRLH
ncbi:MAG: hypothetical protein MMC23_005306 [Stictis urceolatum]|nr:hypothetical protein [Stictis urceolata]